MRKLFTSSVIRLIRESLRNIPGGFSYQLPVGHISGGVVGPMQYYFPLKNGGVLRFTEVVLSTDLNDETFVIDYYGGEMPPKGVVTHNPTASPGDRGRDTGMVDSNGETLYDGDFFYLRSGGETIESQAVWSDAYGGWLSKRTMSPLSDVASRRTQCWKRKPWEMMTWDDKLKASEMMTWDERRGCFVPYQEEHNAL